MTTHQILKLKISSRHVYNSISFFLSLHTHFLCSSGWI